MPIQPINYANIPPHIINGPFHDLDFGALLKQGMHLRHEPQRLLQEREQSELSNALQREKVQQEQAITPFAPENARNESLMKRLKAQYYEPTQQEKLKQMMANTGLIKANTGLSQSQASLMNRTPTYSAFGSAPIREALELLDIGNKKGFDSPDYREAKASVERSHQQDSTRGMTAEEKKDNYFQSLRDIADNPNASPKDREFANQKITQHDSDAIKKANPAQAVNQLAAGVPLQKSIKLFTQRPWITDPKTGDPIQDHSLMWYLTLYSGASGARRKSHDIASHSPEYDKHLEAIELAHILNGQLTKYNKFSVHHKSEEKREEIINPSKWYRTHTQSFKAGNASLKNITIEHQASLDEARAKAGLPLLETDVMGNRRYIKNEAGGNNSKREINPQSNLDTVRNEQKAYRGANPKNQSKNLYWNGSDFVEGGF
jgi:hypothetical protein